MRLTQKKLRQKVTHTLQNVMSVWLLTFEWFVVPFCKIGFLEEQKRIYQQEEKMRIKSEFSKHWLIELFWSELNFLSVLFAGLICHICRCDHVELWSGSAAVTSVACAGFSGGTESLFGSVRGSGTNFGVPSTQWSREITCGTSYFCQQSLPCLHSSFNTMKFWTNAEWQLPSPDSAIRRMDIILTFISPPN